MRLMYSNASFHIFTKVLKLSFRDNSFSIQFRPLLDHIGYWKNRRVGAGEDGPCGPTCLCSARLAQNRCKNSKNKTNLFFKLRKNVYFWSKIRGPICDGRAASRKGTPIRGLPSSVLNWIIIQRMPSNMMMAFSGLTTRQFVPSSMCFM